MPQLGKPCNCTRCTNQKFTRERGIPNKSLSATSDSESVLKAEHCNCFLKKKGFHASGFEEIYFEVGPHNLDHNTRQTSTRTQIEERTVFWQVRYQRKTIKNMTFPYKIAVIAGRFNRTRADQSVSKSTYCVSNTICFGEKERPRDLSASSMASSGCIGYTFRRGSKR